MIKTPMSMNEVNAARQLLLLDGPCLDHFVDGNFRISGVVLEWSVTFKDDLERGLQRVRQMALASGDWMVVNGALTLTAKIRLTPRF